MRVTVTVDDEHIRVSVLGAVREEIAISKLTGIEVGPDTGLLHGAGIRFFDGATALIVGGSSVRLETQLARYIVSVKEPEAFIADIKSRM